MNYLREYDANCHTLSDIQARIFEKASKEKIPSLYFIKSFSYNEETTMMDNLKFLDGFSSEEEIYISSKRKVKTNRGQIINPVVMHWIGYFYRSFCYLYGFKSKEAFKLIEPNYLVKIYPLYHSQDIRKAIIWAILDLKIERVDPKDKIRKLLLTI